MPNKTHKIIIILGSIILWIGVFYIGTIEGVLFFADYSKGETALSRGILATLIAIITGPIIGYNYPRQWWLAWLGVWLPIFFAGMGIISIFKYPGDQTLDNGFIFAPIIAIGLFSYIGKLVKSKK